MISADMAQEGLLVLHQFGAYTDRFGIGPVCFHKVLNFVLSWSE